MDESQACAVRAEALALARRFLTLQPFAADVAWSAPRSGEALLVEVRFPYAPEPASPHAWVALEEALRTHLRPALGRAARTTDIRWRFVTRRPAIGSVDAPASIDGDAPSFAPLSVHFPPGPKPRLDFPL